MKKDSYRQLLLHPNWQKKRLEIMSRDQFSCVQCGENEKTLNVHHLYYESSKAPWEYPSSALVTLCATCHEYEHETRGEYETGLIRELRRLGLLAGGVGTIRNLVASLRASCGQEKAKESLDAILEAMAWGACEPVDIDELVFIAKEYVSKRLAQLERAYSHKDGSEAT